ncbi:MAG: succinylglutamate desuccinylase/aspartoacylase family protein [Bryobacteraceae bacterium]
MDDVQFSEALPPPGSRRVLKCTGQEFSFDILAVHGTSPGHVLLVTGGIHGDEYEGPAAIHETFDRLEPDKLRGCWLGVPVVNEAAMRVGQRASPIDGVDLARVFPGNPTGTLTERLAHGFGQRVMKLATHYIDLHSGGAALRIVSMAGYKTVADRAVLDIQRRMAMAFGADLVWGTPPLLRPTLWQAEQFGIPAIYAETGGDGRWRQDVDGYRTGVEFVMRSLGMLDGDYPTSPRRYFREAGPGNDTEGHFQVDHPSPCEGLFQPDVDLWAPVHEGQVIARVVDFGGQRAAPIAARRKGQVIMLRRPSTVKEGDALAVVIQEDK